MSILHVRASRYYCCLLVTCRGKLKTEEMLGYCQDVALGMRYMHTMGYIHKQLRAKNILISTSGSCKVYT